VPFTVPDGRSASPVPSDVTRTPSSGKSKCSTISAAAFGFADEMPISSLPVITL
jgi:hypothetical protein